MSANEGRRPVTGSVHHRTAPATRLVAGVLLIFIALLAFAASRLVSEGQRHAYDRGATPAPTYRVTSGKVYQLSSAGGVEGLTKAGVLGTGVMPACTASSTEGAAQPLTLESTKDDVRDLHVFATFRAAATGSFHFACKGIGEVFVDDADDAAPDVSAILVALAAVIGLTGVAAAISGGYQFSGDRLAAAAAAAADDDAAAAAGNEARPPD
jgi:hypothetical protein